MEVVGVVCEYNPFHNGHEKQLRQIRGRFGAQTRIVCVMSGNFVQRGEPALFDKFTRAKAAVLCGADLVLELPVTKALSSAEGFAAGGVAALDALGCVDGLCFGSECGDMEKMMSTARLLCTEAFSQCLREKLAQKISFAAARQQALAALGLPDAPVEKPNDILAVEYCKAIVKTGSHLQPVTFRREGDYHATLAERENPSAAALRRMNRREDWRDYVPEAAMAVFADAETYRLQYGERAVLARLRTLCDAEFQALPFGAEGLWRRFARACRTGQSVEEIISMTKSKRYARSRICRMVLCGYLGLTAEQMEQPAPYLRVLAANQAGGALLRGCRATAAVPIVNAGEMPQAGEFYEFERRCGDLFTLFAAHDDRMQCRTEDLGRIFYQK